eukprot:Rmarinus@m.8441
MPSPLRNTFVVLFILCYYIGSTFGDENVVKFGIAFPTGSPYFDIYGQEMEFGARVAVGLINDNNSALNESAFNVLVGTTVELVSYPTGGSRQNAVFSMLDLEMEGVVAAIGELTSGVTEICSFVSNELSLPIVAPLASSPMFSNKVTFPFFSRMIPSDVQQGFLAYQLMGFFEWNRVAVLYSDDPYGQLLAEEFLEQSGEVEVILAVRYVCIFKTQLLVLGTTEAASPANDKIIYRKLLFLT